MARVTKEVIENRPKEIIDATKKLYQKLPYHEIDFSIISKETELSRPSIYNYFCNREEIFLAILKEEYKAWAEELGKIISEHSALSIPSFSFLIAKSLNERELLLKIQCMNLYEIEEHSREEKLVEFKIEYSRAIDLLDQALMKFFPLFSEKDRTSFFLEFFPFMYGIFPYAYPTEKQVSAMKKAGMKIRKTTIYDASRNLIEDLLEKYQKIEK